MRSSAGVVSVLAAACGLAASFTEAMAQQPRDPSLQSALLRVFPSGQPVRPGGGAGGGSGGGGATDATGPDVSVGEIMISDGCPGVALSQGPFNTGTANPSYWGYGLGTTSCNVGTVNVEWEGQCISGGSNRKPVIPQNMYRLSTVNGSTRFEQVGASWLKHAFTALTCNACLSCNGQGGSVLGVGCSDPYTASRNASQSNPTGSNGGTGPRYQVNPYTGDYPWPIWSSPSETIPSIADNTSRRVRVLKTDLVDTNTTSATQYFGEAIYVTRDDARYGNQRNNASYRRLFMTAASGAMTLEGTSSYNSGTHRQTQAIFAWRDFGNIGVTPTNPIDNSVVITEVGTPGTFNPPNDVPTGDGWFYVGSKATDLGNGTFHYEYAVYNMNSDRMGGSFSVPFPAGAVITNVGWRGVDSHSGIAAEDTTRNEPWDSVVGSSSVTWSAHTPYAGHDYDGKTITAVGTGNPATVTAPSHGLATGNIVLIRNCNASISGSGCYSANSLNGAYRVTVTDASHFTIVTPTGTTVNVAGTTGTFGSPSTLGNGLRWGTLYNFRFDSNALPVNNGQATLGFYKLNMPGFPNSITATAWVPQTLPTPPCYANCDGSTSAPVLNVADFTCFLQRYANNDPYANCDASTSPPTLNVADFTCYLQNYANGCP